MLRLSLFALVGFVSVVFSTAASATCPTFHTLTNGSAADASQVMDNFNYILQCPVFARNVGIGIASAGYSLQVNTGTNQNMAFYTPVHFTSGVTLQSTNDAGSSLEPLELRASSIDLTEGNVGIGIANTGYKLQVNTGTNQNLAVYTPVHFTTGITLESTTDSGSSLQPLELRATSIDLTEGNVGIGIANAGYKLQVNTGTNQNVAVYGPVHFTSGVTLQSTTDSGSSLQPFELRGSSIDLADGNVGIGTSSPGQALDVAGTIRQSNCTTAGTLSTNASGDIICTSDARLKNILGTYSGGLDAIMRITPSRFTYKPTAANPIETFVHAGFIAQDVKLVIPQAVALQRSGYYSLDTTAILAASVNAIKELKALNDRQAAEIRTLRGQQSAALQHNQSSEIKRLRVQNAAVLGRLNQQVAEMQDIRSRLGALERRTVVHTAVNLAATSH